MFRKHLLGIALAVSMVGAFATPAFADGGHGSGGTGGTGVTASTGSGEQHSKENSAVHGTITAVTATSITVNGQAIPLSPSVVVRFHDKVVAVAAIPTGVPAVVELDSSGNAVKIELLQDNSIPKGESYVGTVSAVSATSITVGPYTLNLSSSVQVKYGDRTLSAGAIPTGVKAKVSLDKANTVTQVKLLSDPNIPKGESARGTITAVSSDSITIGSYTLAVDSNTEVRYHDFRLTLAQIPVGVDAKVKVGSDLTVSKIKLLDDPNLPSSSGFRGTVSSVGSGTISIGDYNLTVSPNAQITYKGQRYALSSIQAGWDIVVHLDSTGTVVKIVVKQGPPPTNTTTSNSSGD